MGVETVRERRVTSLDVARRAGVSHTTVSFVINNRHDTGISEETRLRVLKAAADLDYHPHEAARSLRAKSSRVIACAVPEAYNPHHLGTVAGVEAYARRHDYSILRAITNFDPAEERRCFTWLKQRRIDALIISSGNHALLRDEIRELRTHSYIVTSLGGPVEGMDYAGVEDGAGERQAMAHLVALGHRRIGHIYGLGSPTLGPVRLEACLAFAREHGLPQREAWIQRCGPGLHDGYEATRRLLDSCPADELPTALVAVNDFVAGAVLAALHHAGLSVPGDMSVIAFDNTMPAAYTIPPLTTVDCDELALGEQAAMLTIERLADPTRPLVQFRTHPKLVVRESTGPAPDR